MGNYEQLKEAIKAVIKTNGKQEITGQVMQDALLAITSSFGQGALFAGIATPETNPLTPDQNVFYLASESGVYPNFNSLSVADGEIVVFSLSNGQWTKQILSLGGGGSVTIVNEPDEEDLTTVPQTYEKNVIRFKNRAYDEANASGKGYKILRKYWKEVNGVRKNILTQDIINDANTIYEIRYDFDLNGAEIQIKEGCVLNFVGGSFKNGTIIFNNTLLNGEDVLIECFCNGIVKNEMLSPNMFGSKQDGTTDDVPFIQQTIDLLNQRGGGTCKFKNGTYLIGSVNVELSNCTHKGALRIRPNISYVGENNSVIKVKSNSDGYEGLFMGNDQYDSSNIKFENIIFDFNGSNNLYKQEWVTTKQHFLGAAIRVCYAENVTVINCTFKNNSYLNCIVLGYTEHGSVSNCTIIDVAESVQGNTYIYDHSAILSAGKDIKIINNRLINSEYSATKPIGRPRVSTAIECNAIGQIIDNNYIENFNIGILPSPVGETSLENAIITNNVIKHCFNALSIWGDKSEKNVQTNGIIFSKNIIECAYSTGNFAIDIINYSSPKVSNIQITNNLIYNIPKETEGNYSGIYAGNGVRNLLIKGNSFINLSGSAIEITSGYNISISDNNIIKAGTDSKFQDSLNILLLNTKNILEKQSNPTVENVDIRNNIIKGNSLVKECVGFGIIGSAKYINFSNNVIEDCNADFNLDRMDSSSLVNNYFYIFHNSKIMPNLTPNYKVSRCSIITDVNNYKTYYKNSKLQETKWEEAKYILGENFGPTKPTVTDKMVGRIFFDSTTQRPAFCNGVDWLDVDGIKSDIKRKGISSDRPNLEHYFIVGGAAGFLYYDTTLNKYIVWNGTAWVNIDGTNLS